MTSQSNSEDDGPLILWFRQDLRISDNPALVHAAQSGREVLALFVLDEVSPDVRPMGAAQKWWLHHSLESLARDLGKMDVPLVLKRGAATDIVKEIIEETDAKAICWNRRYGEGEQSVDIEVKEFAKERGLEAASFAGLLMHEPSKIRTGNGDPYRVYTPFWKKFRSNGEPRKPLPRPDTIRTYGGKVDSDDLDGWSLLPTKPNWAQGISETWTPGEDAAMEQARHFASNDLDAYDSARDQPGPDRTSRMSPHLRFGEISPYQLWHMCYDHRHTASDKARETWAKELVWREFSYHLLQEWPHLATENFNSKFDSFPWKDNADHLSAWQRGQTGYPIVDAGMRQLWQTGWMHNRVRMIVGSFLVKHLLIDWREGEKWFWDTLVDGDPASNPAQWQWVAGSGADAAPYFRIFNPIMQAEKFDSDGTYIHKYVPELSKLPAKHLSAPWDAPDEVLEKAGVKLGETYPKPIVNHAKARERALDAYDKSKDAAEE